MAVANDFAASQLDLRDPIHGLKALDSDPDSRHHVTDRDWHFIIQTAARREMDAYRPASAAQAGSPAAETHPHTSIRNRDDASAIGLPTARGRNCAKPFSETADVA